METNVKYRLDTMPWFLYDTRYEQAYESITYCSPHS